MANQSTLVAGLVLAERYVVGSRLDETATSEIWRGHDRVLGRPVALKTLRPPASAHPAVVERFRREALAAAKVDHPNLLALYDSIEIAGTPVLVTELVDGRSLKSILETHGRLTQRDVLKIASDLLPALAALHAAGIVHCDLKPANIMIARDNRVVLADFGSALATHPTAELPKRRTATPAYASPELLSGRRVDQRADLYAIGAVLYEALAGRRPFDFVRGARGPQVRLNRQPIPLEDTSARADEPIRAAIMACLVREPGNRVGSAKALADLLDLDIDAENPPPLSPSIVAVSPTLTTIRLPGAASRKALTGALAALTLIVAVGAVAQMTSSESSRTTVAAEATEPRSPRSEIIAAAPTESADNAQLPPATPTTVPVVAVHDDDTEVLALTDAPPAIAAITSFDPFGDRQEHDGELPFINDGVAGTWWTTEVYSAARFGGLKPGTGIVVSLQQSAVVAAVTVDTPVRGWQASIHVIDGARPSEYTDWGPVRGSVVADTTASTITLSAPQRGSHVLVWFTQLAPTEATFEALGDRQGFRVAVDQINVIGP